MPRSPKQVAIADHLWEAFARMAEEMGADRDGLVNQAMHVFARLNGYVVPGSPGPAGDVGRPPPVPEGSAPTPPPQERKVVAERVLATAERLERDMAAQPPPVPAARKGALRLEREDGSAHEVAKDRYVIGRGAHCDLVVDSAKISREHAAVVREPDGWWMEDLGSSNGTWLHGERVGRRPIADGDEYFLCSERIRCVLR